MNVTQTTYSWWEFTLGQSLPQITIMDLQVLHWWVLILQTTDKSGWHICVQKHPIGCICTRWKEHS